MLPFQLWWAMKQTLILQINTQNAVISLVGVRDAHGLCGPGTGHREADDRLHRLHPPPAPHRRDAGQLREIRRCQECAHARGDTIQHKECDDASEIFNSISKGELST